MRDRITIAATIDRVWPYVADPELMASWNPKLVGIDRERVGVALLGERFQFTYRMSGKSLPMQVTVVELQAPVHLLLQHVQDPARPDRFVLEEYHLAERDGKTTLRQRIHYAKAGLPLWLRPLIWLINTFGRPTGKRYLEELRDLVEAESAGKKPRGNALNVAP